MKTLLLSILLWTFSSGTNDIVTEMQSKAINGKQKIAVYFSGSDWCSNCHEFSNSILAFPEIGAMLSKDYVYYTADFPQRKKQDKETIAANAHLADKLNPEGIFPVLIITDENFNVIARIHKGHSRAEVLDKLAEVKRVSNGQ